MHLNCMDRVFVTTRVCHRLCIVYDHVLVANVERINFLDPVAAIQSEVDRLGALNINKIFVLGHGGYSFDKTLAKELQGVDVIIGGHSHTFIYSGEIL